MVIVINALSLFFIALAVFVPLFGIAFFILRSAMRAFAIASVFAIGAVAGFFVAGTLASRAIGHAVSGEVRDALGVAFILGGAVAGGTLALWLLERNNPNRPWRRT